MVWVNMERFFIRETSLLYKYCIGGIQVIMSNGRNSPVFLGKGMNADDLEEVKITPFIKKIRGTIVGAWPR